MTLIAVAIAFFREDPADDPPSKAVRTNTAQKENPKKIKTALPLPVAQIPTAAPMKEIKIVPPQTPAAKERVLPKDHVEFEIVGDKIALAFGDVILGRLESELKTERGLSKPPRSKLWPTNIIPFAIKEGTPSTQHILEAIKYFNENTAVQFVLRTDETDGVLFEGWGEDRCAAYLGTVGGLQPIFIGPNCRTQEVLHEIMHTLGFVHEQSRTDRDRYVRILWENILEGFANQFDIVPDGYIHPYTGSVFHFDYESVMLYRPESFAKSPDLKTIEAIGDGKIAPVHQGLSARDLERLHYLY